MHVLLLCEKTAPALFPLAGELPVALLPLAGKSVAEYQLELICGQARPETVQIYGGAYRNLLQHRFGDGSRWGVTLDYAAGLAARPVLPLLVLPCDRLSGFDLAGFLQRIAEQPGQSAVAMADGKLAACWIARQADWREVVAGSFDLDSARQIPCAGAALPIATLRAYYEASLGLLRGHFPGLNLAPDQTGDALLLGGRARVAASAQRCGHAYVGEGSRVGDGVTLAGDCVIGPHVLVDSHAVLENCVILPHSYIGRWVSLRNAVVCGPHLWRMDSGDCLRVEQRFLLSRLPAADGGGWLSRWLGRDGRLQSSPNLSGATGLI